MCDDDINECNSSLCIGDYEICFNILGFFWCDCVLGFKNSFGMCEGLDDNFFFIIKM